MHRQLLLNTNPLARSSDPITSHLAAKEGVESGRIGRNMEMALMALRRNPGVTSAELSEFRLAPSRQESARRLPDLEKRGLAEKGVSRTCKVTGRLCVTWWPVKN